MLFNQEQTWNLPGQSTTEGISKVKKPVKFTLYKSTDQGSGGGGIHISLTKMADKKDLYLIFCKC